MPIGHPFSTGFRVLFEHAMFELRNVFGDGPPQSTFTLSEVASGPRDAGVIGHNPYEVELQRFVSCIRGGGDPELLDVERAIEALRMSIATQRSLAEHRAVALATIR